MKTLQDNVLVTPDIDDGDIPMLPPRQLHPLVAHRLLSEGVLRYCPLCDSLHVARGHEWEEVK